MMFENENELNSQETLQSNETPVETTNEQVVEEVANNATQPSQQVIDWLADERAERMWKKDPNEMYKSYRNLEEKVLPYKKKYDEVSKLVEGYGYKTDNLSELFEEYQKLVDPNAEHNQKLSYLDRWLNNPVYRDKVVNYFNELEAEDMRRRFPGMNDEQIAKWQSMEAEQKATQERLSQFEREKQTQQDTQEIVSQLKKIMEYSNARGFQFSDEIKQSLIDDAISNNVPPKYLFAHFAQKHSNDLDNAYRAKLQNEITGNIKKNKEGSVITGSQKRQTPPSTRFNTMEEIKKGLGRALDGWTK